MKKVLLFAIGILLSFISFGQIDSSKLKPTVTVKAKDLYYVKGWIRFQQKYEDLDSVINAMCRPAVNCPANNADVTITVVENRVWLHLARFLFTDALALDGNVTKRISDALLLTSHSWLITKLNSDAQKRSDYLDEHVETGKKIAKKELQEEF